MFIEGHFIEYVLMPFWNLGFLLAVPDRPWATEEFCPERLQDLQALSNIEHMTSCKQNTQKVRDIQ